MKNVNYTKFSEEEKKIETPVVEEPVFEEEVEEPDIEEEVEEPVIEEEVPLDPAWEYAKVVPSAEESEEFIGVVENCVRLNVRKEPKSNAAVLKIIDAGTEVVVIDEPTDDFYKVQVAGYTGFCMKEFITIE